MSEVKKRVQKAAEKAAKKKERAILAKALHEGGHSDTEIAKALGVKEAVVRNLLKEESDE